MKIYLDKEDFECIESVGCLYINGLPLEMIKINKGYKIEWMKHASSFRIIKANTEVQKR